MELLDRATFLEWMERIMKRFDDLKQTTPDIPQRPMLNGEPLLDNQEVCLMLQISKRTLQRYRASGTLPFHIVYHSHAYPCLRSFTRSVLRRRYSLFTSVIFSFPLAEE